MNSGGTVLSYSDLLLSIATAQWSSLDAREAVHGLVDELNRMGHGFSFTKDIVLKAGLMLGEIGSVQFRVTNFNQANMTVLEERWESIESALRLAARVLADFGFSERTLSASSVLLPDRLLCPTSLPRGTTIGPARHTETTARRYVSG